MQSMKRNRKYHSRLPSLPLTILFPLCLLTFAYFSSCPYREIGLLNDADQERFDRLRYVELKHGRICQLAFLGQIVTRGGTHLPGDIDLDGHSFDSYPNGIAAIIGPDAIPLLGLAQIIGFIGALELFVMKDGKSMLWRYDVM